MNFDWNWFFCEVNPEPWAIGDLGVGQKGGKYYPTFGRNHQMYAYQQAIKEAIPKDHGLWFIEPIQLHFYFYRTISTYQSHQARSARSHEADATNMQKATEDALQGVFFKNDKEVKVVGSSIVIQQPDINPGVIIGIRQLDPNHEVQLPAGAQEAHDMYFMKQAIRDGVTDPNAWGPGQQ